MYQLNSEQAALVKRVTQIAESTIGPAAEEVDTIGQFPQESISALADAGILGLPVDGKFGGHGQGIRAACAALDEVSQRCASTGMIFLMHLCGLSCYNANKTKMASILKLVAKGQHLSTLAWSEAGSRSHFWAPVSKEVQDGDRVRISAEKSWVTSAGYADGYVISTRSADATTETESTLYFVPKSAEGFVVAGPWDALGMRGNASSPMKLTDVAVDAKTAALSEPGKGFKMMLGTVMPWFLLGNAAVAIGIAEAAIASTTAHMLHSRLEHKSTTLADLPNLRERLAQMRLKTDRARAHLASTIFSVEHPDANTQRMVFEAKASASETALEVTDLSMKACGGAAFSRHLSVERNFRDARAMTIMAPTTDVALDMVGRILCGMSIVP